MANEDNTIQDIGTVKSDLSLRDIYESTKTGLYKTLDTFNRGINAVHRSSVLLDESNKAWSYQQFKKQESKTKEILESLK